MIGDLPALAVDFMARTALLTVLLWIMIKLQKFDYVLISLIGAAAIASGLDMIPVVGHYVAVPVLYFCVWKITQSSLVPDAMFTVVIAYALMFLVNILLLTAFIGDLRPSARLRDAGDLDDTNETQFAESSTAATPARPAGLKSLFHSTNSGALQAKSGQGKASPPKPAATLADNFTLKGITRNADKSMALIDTGVKTYSLYVGDLTPVKIPEGNSQLQLKEVGPGWASVLIDGKPVILKLH